MGKVLAVQVTGELEFRSPNQHKARQARQPLVRGDTEMVYQNKMELEISGFSEIIFLN